jgi:hypothetical protein
LPAAADACAHRGHDVLGPPLEQSGSCAFLQSVRRVAVGGMLQRGIPGHDERANSARYTRALSERGELSLAGAMRHLAHYQKRAFVLACAAERAGDRSAVDL